MRVNTELYLREVTRARDAECFSSVHEALG
jgi:hypothetical protein